MLVDTEANSNSLHNLHVQILADFKEAQHFLSEHFSIVVEAIGPFVFQAFDSLTTDFEGFFQVCSFKSSLLFDLDRINKVSCLFASLTDIATVGLRSCPGQLLLLANWSLEKLCAVSESFFYRRFINSMVADVDEAGGLEA